MKAWKVRFSIEGERIFTAGNSGKVFEYDTESGELFSDFLAGQSFVSSLDVSNIGDLAIGNAVGDLYLKALQEKPSQLITDHKKYLRCIKFTQDATKIIIASDDLRISLYDLYCFFEN